LADKILVSDAEIDQYIKDNTITIPEGQEGAYRAQIKSQLSQQKLSQEAGALINDLRFAGEYTIFRELLKQGT